MWGLPSRMKVKEHRDELTEGKTEQGLWPSGRLSDYHLDTVCLTTPHCYYFFGSMSPPLACELRDGIFVPFLEIRGREHSINNICWVGAEVQKNHKIWVILRKKVNLRLTKINQPHKNISQYMSPKCHCASQTHPKWGREEITVTQQDGVFHHHQEMCHTRGCVTWRGIR